MSWHTCVMIFSFLINGFLDHFCGLEVDFAKVFANCIESLKATQPVEISRKSTNLTNIKSAAAAGLLSSTVRTLVNDLLRHKCIDMNQKMHDHPLEEMQCFAAISICFDLVTSAELHSAVCKTILDISEELIKSGIFTINTRYSKFSFYMLLFLLLFCHPEPVYIMRSPSHREDGPI